MERLKTETVSERLARLAAVAKTLTQDQIDACQYVMGTESWTSGTIAERLKDDATSRRRLESAEGL